MTTITCAAAAATGARSVRAAYTQARQVSSAAGPAAPAYKGNWLEENCGDVPLRPQKQDDEISEMLRGGHAIQMANQKLLDGKVRNAYAPARNG